MGDYPHGTRIFDTINAVAGMSKEGAKEWILEYEIVQETGEKSHVSEKYADRIASLILATDYTVSKAICLMFMLFCDSRIDPEKSILFRKMMFGDGLSAHADKLQSKATDLSLRSSSAKHKKMKSSLSDFENVFGV